MNDLTALQLVVTAFGTLILPLVSFYVKSSIERAISSLKTDVQKQFFDFREEYAKDRNDSTTTHVHLEKRLSFVEMNHESIQTRIDILAHAVNRAIGDDVAGLGQRFRQVPVKESHGV
jgi:hypothetical protein